MPKSSDKSRRPAVSEKRLAANRANAAKSTGPKTPEGKQRSAQNAVKHGFTATSFTVARFEEIREVERLKADAVSVYRPVNSQEMFAVERIALAQQQILRSHRLEAGLFTEAFDGATNANGSPFTPMSPAMIEGNVPITRAQNRNYALAKGFHRVAAQSNAWTLMLRYQAQAERLYRRAIEEFERLKALRKDLPNEPIDPGQPEEKPDLATLQDLNINDPDYTYNPDPTGADPFAALDAAPFAVRDAVPASEPRPKGAVELIAHSSKPPTLSLILLP